MGSLRKKGESYDYLSCCTRIFVLLIPSTVQSNKNRAVYAEDGNLKGIIYCLRYVQYFEDPSRISERIDREVASEHEKQQEEYESKEFDEWVKGITNKIQNSTSFPEGCFIMNLYSQGSEELGPSQFNITKQWTIEDIKRYNSGQPLPLLLFSE